MPRLSINDKKIDCSLVIFDMDGTLIDVNHRLESLAKARTEIMKCACNIGDFSTRIWAKASGINLKTGKVDINGALAVASRSEDLMVAASAIAYNGVRWEEAKKIAKSVYSQADETMASTYKPVLLPGILETINNLLDSGFKIAVATNAPNVSAIDLMKSVNLYCLLETVVGADDVKKSKPAPDMILLACKRCETVPQMAIYIGDTPGDMEAGRKADVSAVIAINSEHMAEYSDYDTIINSFKEIQIIR